MHKNIIFDIGNVLLKWDLKAILLTFFKEDEAKIVEPILKEKWPLLDTGYISNEDFFILLKDKIPTNLHNKFKKLLDNWPKAFIAYEESNELVNILARKHDLYILSNMPSSFLKFEKNYPFFKKFKGKIYSSNEKITKPNKYAYLNLLERYSLKASDCLFIDDNIDNINAASKLGISCYQFDNLKRNDFLKFLKKNREI